MDENRNFFRVTREIPLSITTVSKESNKLNSASITSLGAFPGIPPRIFSSGDDLGENLRLIHEKLDWIIQALTTGGPVLPDLRPAQVSLSSGGMGVEWNAGFPIGDPVEIKMLLANGTRQRVFTLFGTIIRSQEVSRFWDLGIEFAGLDGWFENEIANYVLNAERGL